MAVTLEPKKHQVVPLELARVRESRSIMCIFRILSLFVMALPPVSPIAFRLSSLP